MVKLAQIAEAAGFSVSIVSRVLNPNPKNPGKIAEATQCRIREVARQMGFRPNRAAEFLQRGQLPTIGVFMPHYRNSLITDLVMGISAEASANGFPIAFSFDTNYASYRKFLEENRSQCNCGIITYPHFNLDAKADQLICKYLDEGGKMVLINAEDFMPQVPHVEIDERKGGEIAAEELASAGCTRLFLLTASMLGRSDGFREYARRAAIPLVEYLAIDANFTKVIDFCRDARETIGIFVSADREAVRLYSLLLQDGIIPGGKIKLIGYDDLFLTNCLKPALSTIAQPFVEAGHCAVKTLVDTIYGKPVQNTCLLPTLVRRETT